MCLPAYLPACLRACMCVCKLLQGLKRASGPVNDGEGVIIPWAV